MFNYLHLCIFTQSLWSTMPSFIFRFNSALNYLFFALILLLLIGPINAQNYPNHPIRLLIGFPPGGGADVVGRALAQKMTDSMGQSFIVDNRSGANGAIATELAARAPSDGYTLILNTIGHATNASLMKLNFDSMKDFSFISKVADSQNLLVVHPSFPAKTIPELINLSRKNPNTITYGTQGIGASGHLSGELFQSMAHVKWIHVPYKGGSLALLDLISGNISLSFGNIPTLIGQVRNKKLRAIALSGLKRSPAIPNVPTISESGLPGFEVVNWFGMSAPAKTPSPLIDRLHSEIVVGLKNADLSAAYFHVGADPVGSTPLQYTQFMQAEINKWAKVMQAAGITGENH